MRGPETSWWLDICTPVHLASLASCFLECAVCVRLRDITAAPSVCTMYAHGISSKVGVSGRFLLCGFECFQYITTMPLT